jgi:hypothetical protein
MPFLNDWRISLLRLETGELESGPVAFRFREIFAMMILAACLGGPVLEIFDRWDDTARTGNDTETELVVIALCVGVALVTVRALAMPVGNSSLIEAACFRPIARRLDRFVRPLPIPAASPPAPLRV